MTLENTKAVKGVVMLDVEGFTQIVMEAFGGAFKMVGSAESSSVNKPGGINAGRFLSTMILSNFPGLNVLVE